MANTPTPKVKPAKAPKANMRAKKAAAKRLVRIVRLKRGYVLVCLLILLASTLVWAILGARLQNGNADQLVNGYLFQDSRTFHAAQFPGQHSQLLKWPLFWLLKAVGYSTTSFTIITAAVVLLTIAVFAYILYRIERRPLVFGTLCLALASVLLLVPPQPYAGGILPVNMAMLTTRNIEYVLYIGSLILIAKTIRLKSWRFALATAALTLLFASDKLFATLSLGGAVLALVVYLVFRRWAVAAAVSNWLLASILALVLAVGGTWVVNATGLTHITGQDSASPYGLIHSVHDLVLGGLYAVLGVGTNLGANPAFDAVTVRGIPHAALSRLESPTGIAFVINALLLLSVLTLAARELWLSLRKSGRPSKGPGTPIKLAIMLLWTSVAGLGVFVLSKHDYVVDARYLAIVFFALFITMATYLRTRQLKPVLLLGAGLLLTVSTALGLSFANTTYHADKAALAPLQSRDSIISQTLARHPVQVLVGDYWRVLPIKLTAPKALTIMPLSDCTTPRSVLSSSAWNPDLRSHSFVYLLSLDRSLTDFPRCSLAQVTGAYGRPNANVVISGSLEHPQELLLFYDHGMQKRLTPASSSAHTTSNTIVPVPLSKLPHVSCSQGTVMNIVAHQDDDLLFMNPDLLHSIQGGKCIRTVYITAGDGGGDKFYWLGREQGSEAAYSQLMGMHNLWIQRTVKLAHQEFATVVNPVGNGQVSLLFLHLPDGNPSGTGYAVSHYESLARLLSGAVPQIHSVDGQSVYTSAQLTAALEDLMMAYGPAEVRTQSSYQLPNYNDHSDHRAVGQYTHLAYDTYIATHPQTTASIKFYIGYPIHTMPENVSGADFSTKTKVFFEYARFDGAVCNTIQSCTTSYTYGSYLHRQYTSNY